MSPKFTAEVFSDGQFEVWKHKFNKWYPFVESNVEEKKSLAETNF